MYIDALIPICPRMIQAWAAAVGDRSQAFSQCFRFWILTGAFNRHIQQSTRQAFRRSTEILSSLVVSRSCNSFITSTLRLPETSRKETG